MYENIITNITKCITLTEEEQKLFTALLECRVVPKKSILLREGEICKFEGYIQRGCARVYYLNENGFEVTLSFAVEDWWISDIASFHEGRPSKFFIETLEETELYILTPQTKEKLIMAIPNLNEFFAY